MQFSTLLFLAASASCAASAALPDAAGSGLTKRTVGSRVSSGVVWPSLARRPAESMNSEGARDKATTVAVSKPLPFQDGAARLAVAARDVEQLEQRWRTQLLATQRSTVAERSQPVAEVEAAAQLEAGRLDKLAGQVADARSQIESITGDLAMAAAAGVDVSGPLRTAGALLNRCAKLKTTSPVSNDRDDTQAGRRQ